MGRQLDRGLMIAAAAIMVALLVIGGINYYNTSQLEKNLGRVIHTHRVLDKVNDYYRKVVDAETGQRGFLLTGRDDYLKPYSEALTSLDAVWQELMTLTADNRNQQNRLKRLHQLVEERIVLLSEGIEARRVGKSEADEFLARGAGKDKMDEIRDAFASVAATEESLLGRRAVRSEQARTVAMSSTILSTLLGLCLVGMVSTVLNRSWVARQQAAAAIRAERQWLHTILTSIGDAVISTDPNGNVSFLNRIAEQLTGWTSEDAQGRALPDVFNIVNEQSRLPVENPALRALREGVIVGLANHTILLARDGREIPIDDSAAPIRNERNQVIGSVLVFRDIAHRREAERQLESSEAELADFFETATLAIKWISADGTLLRLNQAAVDLIGYAREDCVMQPMKNLFQDERCMDEILAELHAGKSVRDWPAVLRIKDGSTRHVLLDCNGRWEDGKLVHARCFVRDVTAAKRMENATRLLAESSSALANIVNDRQTLERVAELAVQTFADWAVIDLVQGPGQSERVAVAHHDPAKTDVARDLLERFAPEVETLRGIGRILKTGLPEFVREISDEFLSQAITNPELREIANQLGVKSYIGVPIRVGGEVLGVMSLVAAESKRVYSPEDLEVAEELARRSGIALENARLYRELKEADQRKDEFLATLAHELRNPLAPIKMALDLLRLAGPSENLSTLREMLERQVRQMVHLVDDLLDVSRITRGKIALRKQRLEFGQVLQIALETCRPLIEAGKHRFQCQPSSEPVHIHGDATRLAQVISNLLTNSAKYTPEGGDIWLRTAVVDGQLEIRVRDTGVGIPSEMLPQIFEMFTQVDRNLGRAQGGLGIGLALVKRLVELHDGTVAATSPGLGMGSEFTIRLPLAAGELLPPLDALPALTAEMKASPLKIVVVDDNRDSADTLGSLLRILGHEVAIAYDGYEALDKAARLQPHLFLLDLGLPGMSGFELAKKIRQTPEFAKAVLIAQTGWGQSEDKQRSADAGFRYHLVKPVDFDYLQKVLAVVAVEQPGASQATGS